MTRFLSRIATQAVGQVAKDNTIAGVCRWIGHKGLCVQVCSAAYNSLPVTSAMTSFSTRIIPLLPHRSVIVTSGPCSIQGSPYICSSIRSVYWLHGREATANEEST